MQEEKTLLTQTGLQEETLITRRQRLDRELSAAYLSLLFDVFTPCIIYLGEN